MPRNNEPPTRAASWVIVITANITGTKVLLRRDAFNRICAHLGIFLLHISKLLLLRRIEPFSQLHALPLLDRFFTGSPTNVVALPPRAKKCPLCLRVEPLYCEAADDCASVPDLHGLTPTVPRRPIFVCSLIGGQLFAAVRVCDRPAGWIDRRGWGAPRRAAFHPLRQQNTKTEQTRNAPTPQPNPTQNIPAPIWPRAGTVACGSRVRKPPLGNPSRLFVEFHQINENEIV